MKLNSAQIAQTLDQIDAQAVPEDHPMVAQLEPLFGEQTYFLDGSGLNIVEPGAAETGGSRRLGLVVNVANWTDANSPELVPHEPEATDMVVRLSAPAS